MPTNIHNVSFVNPLDPAGSAALQVQQQQIQRQQAIAQALQQQSMQEEQVAPGSRISWTQGLGKLAQALAARDAFKKTDAQQVDLATKQGQAMARMFGLPSQQAPQQSLPDDSSQPIYGGGTQGNTHGVLSLAGGTGAPQGSAPSGNIAQIAAALAPQAQAEAQANPMPADSAVVPPEQPQATQQPMPQQRGPMSLSGNPMQDYVDYSSNPEEYTKALIANHAPVDMAKMVQQAHAAMQSGDFATAQALLANIEKQNNIPLQPGRPGAPMYDHTGRVVAISPQNIEGANPVVENGHFTGSYTASPGAAGVVQQVAAAKATGSAAGDLVDVYNPNTHQMVKVPKSVALGSGSAGSPLPAGPALGTTKAFDVSGTNSANAFQTISDGAADVPNRLYALNQMSSIVADPKTVLGPGSEPWNKVRGVLGTLTGTAAPSTTNAQEFSKWANQYSARSAQELGLSGSDARVQIAIHATPNGEMTKDALRSVIPQMAGIEHAKQGYASAAVAWQQAHGPDTAQEFRAEWNKIYNPAIYTHMVQGPQAFVGWVKSLNPQQAAQVRQQYVQLKQLGALPQ